MTDAFGIFRVTDNQLLGTCGKMYKPILNDKGFELVDALLELADEGAYHETAGALGKGERIWALARIPGEFNVAGEDKIEPFILWHTRHDGNGSAIAKLIFERVVCANTLAIALNEKGAEIRIPHFGDVDAKIEAAKKLMAAATDGVMRIREKFDILANRIVTKANFMAVVDKLFPETQENVAARVVGNARAERIAVVAELFASNDKNAIPAVKGTAYNLLNAVTEYTDHYSGTDKSRARSAMFGAGEALKTQAVEIILEETANAATIERPIYTRPAPTPMLDAIIEASATVN
jgi:phage/plasmid-like protein (TIGR03299 family)